MLVVHVCVVGCVGVVGAGVGAGVNAGVWVWVGGAGCVGGWVGAGASLFAHQYQFKNKETIFKIFAVNREHILLHGELAVAPMIGRRKGFDSLSQARCRS